MTMNYSKPRKSAVTALAAIAVACSVAIAADFYQDPKGLYSFVPPRGWTQKNFSDPRSKIEYFDPSNPSSDVLIIAVAMEKTSIAEFKARRDRLKNAFPGAIITTDEINVSGEAAVKHSIDFGNVKQQDVVMFYKDGYEYSISFGAKDKATLQRLSPVFDAVLVSFKVGSGSTPSEADIHKAQCASWLRLVEIFRKLGKGDNATYYAGLASQANCEK